MKNYTKNLLFGTAILLGGMQAASAQCIAGFTWNQPSNNVIDFTNTSSPIVQNSTMFFWDFGDNQNGYSQNPSHTYNVPGTDYVCVNMYDSLQTCQSSFCDSVTVTGTVICNLSV